MTDAAPLDVARAVWFAGGSVFEVTLLPFGGRDAIVKRVRRELGREPRAQRALEREHAALTMLAGRHAPRLLASELAAGGELLCVWQERARGRSLLELVEATGPFAGPRLERLMGSAFEALTVLHGAHDEGGALELSHGDLKPEHIFIDGDDITFVDFGMARFRGLSLSPAAREEQGTLPYVAPEVLRGEAALDQAADVYALAVVLLFAALGAEPGADQAPSFRLLTLAEKGLAAELVAGCAGLSARGRATLAAALTFDRKQRTLRADELTARLTR